MGSGNLLAQHRNALTAPAAVTPLVLMPQRDAEAFLGVPPFPPNLDQLLAVESMRLSRAEPARLPAELARLSRLVQRLPARQANPQREESPWMRGR